MRGEQLERVAHKRVLRETVDARVLRRYDVDAVGQADALVDVQWLVLAVLAPRPDDEREIDLRGCGRSHASACVSATKSPGSRASARVNASRPIAVSARAAASREARPASSSEFGRVLRRCANAAPTTPLTSG